MAYRRMDAQASALPTQRAVEGPPAGQVTCELSALMDAVEFAMKQAQELESRISLVLAQQNPVTAAEGKSEPPVVPIAEAIRDAARRVNQIGYVLQSMKERTEI